MGKRYQLVIFDWEGTLADALGQVLYCLNTEASRLQLGEVDEDLVRRYAYLGLALACQKVFPQLTNQQLEALVDAVQQSLWAQHGKVFLFKGAKELIQRLDLLQIVLAIATNKGQQSLQRALENSGLDRYFTIRRSAGQVPPKPCPQMLEEILAEAAIPIEKALMIGDSESDILMAKSIGMDAVGVNFYHQDETLRTLLNAGADAVFDDYLLIADFMDCK